MQDYSMEILVLLNMLDIDMMNDAMAEATKQCLQKLLQKLNDRNLDRHAPAEAAKAGADLPVAASHGLASPSTLPNAARQAAAENHPDSIQLKIESGSSHASDLGNAVDDSEPGKDILAARAAFAAAIGADAETTYEYTMQSMLDGILGPDAPTEQREDLRRTITEAVGLPGQRKKRHPPSPAMKRDLDIANQLLDDLASGRRTMKDPDARASLAALKLGLVEHKKNFQKQLEKCRELYGAPAS